MTRLRIGIVVASEFSRLVLRHLLRHQANVEVISELDSLARAQEIGDADLVLLQADLCHADPLGFAAVRRRYPRQCVVIAAGEGSCSPPGAWTPDVTVIGMGSATNDLDPSVFHLRLKEVLQASNRVLQSLQKEQAPSDQPVAPLRRLSYKRPAIIGVAASTGGPEALQALCTDLLPPICPIVVALHIPREHTAGLARHLADVTGHAVSIGEAGPLPQREIILLLGGVDHAVVNGVSGFALRRVVGHASNFHPNGDVLLSSLAALDRPAVGIVLTGMGIDGSAGVRALGARRQPVLVQLPSTCVVSGMPEAAIATGCVSEVGSIGMIARRLNILMSASR